MVNLSKCSCKEHDEFLIWLYLFIEQAYKDFLFVNCQRLSNNNTPRFTDIELLTTFLFGQTHGFNAKKNSYLYRKPL